MKTCMAVLAIAGMMLTACSPGAQPSAEVAPTQAEESVEQTPQDAEEVAPETMAPDSEMSEAPPPKEQWRLAINNVVILFSACELMFETHYKVSDGEIDLERAVYELTSEGDLISFATRGFASGPVPSETVAPYLFELEQQMTTLISYLDPIDESAIGSAVVLESLQSTCTTLDSLQQEVVNASVEDGLTWEEVDEIDSSISPMLRDFYGDIRGG